MKKTVLKVLFNLAVLLVVGGLILGSVTTPNTVGEDYSPAVFATPLALLPPVIAIALALITKEVYSALFVGVAVGAMLYAGGNPELAYNTMLYHESGGMVTAITDVSHASIIVFVIVLATIVVLMNRAGGAAAFGRWAQKHIKTRVGAQLATIVMGLLIFVDDGFNCMTVGSVMRPITDGHGVSRAKLAYLIDSTAAPICIIAPISCWAAAVSYAVPDTVEINGFAAFIHTIPYNLYALGTVFMVFAVTLLKLDFGPMRTHEQNAMKGDLFTAGERPYEDPDEKVNQNGIILDLVLPVAVLIVFCILGMLYTGGFFTGANIIDAFANADSAVGLVMGSILAVIVIFVYYVNRGNIKFNDFMGSFAAGFRTMCQPMIILVLAWNLTGITGLLGAADYIDKVMSASAGELQMFVPVIVFIVSVFLSFSTGTSWGTFTILIPIVCAVFPADSEMLIIAISACLAGAVCGDHCSPISDTTIMSSAGAKSDHINHVTTQLPYAITVAVCCGVGYLISGIMGYYLNNALAMLATPLTFALILAAVLMIRRRESKKA